ncbi:hypothetical protein CLU79DRAFT_699895, partial [Phycomyces nitens]
NPGLVKFALDHGAPIDAVVNGFMPLQLACISDNNIAVVQYLIDRGAGVNSQRWSKKHSADKSQAVAGAIGSTALHVACANGCAKIVDLLLRNGAKVNVKDKYGSRPMDIAAAKHHAEIVKLLETFGSMQHQESILKHRDEGTERRSMDVSSTRDERTERLRRPSLPAIFEGKSQRPGLPPLSTLPIRRESEAIAEIETTDSIDIRRRHGRPDWYGYGVVNHYEDDTYLASLERRAFGLGEDANERAGRASLDQCRPARTSIDAVSPSLKRCSSDGGHLRTTALMNAMAANANQQQQQEDEPAPRPSVALDDGPEAEALRQFHEKEMKKAWWSAFGGRKSMDVATYQYHHGRTSMDSPRKSIDFRPSFEGLSYLAKKSVEGLSRRSIDCSEDDGRNFSMADIHPSALARKNSKAGFLSRWVGAWSKK